jgi:hypothetical protein
MYYVVSTYDLICYVPYINDIHLANEHIPLYNYEFPQLDLGKKIKKLASKVKFPKIKSKYTDEKKKLKNQIPV